MPNQNDIGNLEILLSEIAVDRKLIECFKRYELCVKDYEKPLVKSRIYTYLDTLLYPHVPKSKNDDLRLIHNCDFTNTTHWNLHHEYLQPLYNFLAAFFS
jgi:hypothetical protein